MTTVELLSPAKNVNCGIAAIDHGADAVYIGAPAFGARSAAANSIDDIAKLVEYAHAYFAKVYVALNTILFNHEIDKAVEIAHLVYNAGADALIIQDMGLLECNLPPIALHASTQMHTTTVEKVSFLEHVGFSQVVLARELSLEQIQTIRKNTQVPLEVFIHGALCICYSGQCYMSAYATGRSGNRGECSQMCRHLYSIEGLPTEKNTQAFYLSPKDLSLQHHIGALIDAGVHSFKIEGRLKDEIYVKNCTAFYRKIIDYEISQRTHIQKSSHGAQTFTFTPDINKTFSRQFTDYYIQKKQNTIANFDTPKSQGEYIGRISKIEGKKICIETNVALRNGDGLCFFNSAGELSGVRVNSVTDNYIELTENVNVPIGTRIWRNLSVQFEKQVEQSNHCRYIEASIQFQENQQGYTVFITDEYGYEAFVERIIVKYPAVQVEKMKKSIQQQLSKTGQSNFKITHVSIDWHTPFFIQIAELNEARRLLIQQLQTVRLEAYVRIEKTIIPNAISFPLNVPIDARLNVSNVYAQAFYKRHGIHITPQAFELQKDNSIPLMTTKYCIRFETGNCPKQNNNIIAAEPIHLKDNKHRYRVEFNCKRCEMLIFSETER